MKPITIQECKDYLRVQGHQVKMWKREGKVRFHVNRDVLSKNELIDMAQREWSMNESKGLGINEIKLNTEMDQVGDPVISASIDNTVKLLAERLREAFNTLHGAGFIVESTIYNGANYSYRVRSLNGAPGSGQEYSQEYIICWARNVRMGQERATDKLKEKARKELEALGACESIYPGSKDDEEVEALRVRVKELEEELEKRDIMQEEITEAFLIPLHRIRQYLEDIGYNVDRIENHTGDGERFSYRMENDNSCVICETRVDLLTFARRLGFKGKSRTLGTKGRVISAKYEDAPNGELWEGYNGE